MITDMTTPNPFAMNSDELMAFLAEPRFMAATTLRKDGTPITIFLGFEWDGEAMVFSLRNSRLLNRRLARNSRIVMAVTNEFAPAKYVVMEGNAEIIPDDDREISIRGLVRYMSPDSDFQTQKDIDFDGFIEPYFEVGRTVYRVVPDSIKSEDGAKWQAGAAGISDDLAKKLDGEES
jgi:hypothetical protein